jgi:2-amino-4-hydroxy-6-hydroxymethyldihydropteridine diphosphokinase
MPPPPTDSRDRFAFVALGSNLGDSLAILRRAFEELEGFSSEPLRRSSIWQTTPVDCPPGSPLFLNAVAALAPRRSETPETLLIKLKAMESEFGRRPKLVLNEPRPLDLDLIAFGREVRESDALVLPHPRAHQRRFVLQPLAEIAPDLILPHQQKSIGELLQELPGDEMLVRLP